MDRPADQSVWEDVDRIPDGELWRTHERRRERLVAVARRRLRKQLAQRGASPRLVAIADEVLDPEALTIGFARRFAPYKRGTLLFRDPERLARLLRNAEMPVQIIYAGKAHPRDDKGKEMIRQIVQARRRDTFRDAVVFLEDYDMSLAHYLVSGVDVWLNTPRRPLEASGTSGMKIAVNGGPNISILDGWWCEGYAPENGWAIGRGEEYDDPEVQDAVESQALYDLLEEEVVPTFYERGGSGVPRKWVQMMKANLRRVCPVFNTNRMVQEYTERLYLPALDRARTLCANALADARALSGWQQTLRSRWHAIKVLSTELDTRGQFAVGDELPVRAQIQLGDISPDDVAVELYEGEVGVRQDIRDASVVTLTCESRDDAGICHYAGTIPCRSTGRHGCVLRIMPHHPLLGNPHDTGLILWV